MTPETLTLATLVLGGGGLSAILVFVASMRRAPVERTTAQAAASSEIADAARELIAPLREEVARLRGIVDESRDDARQARGDAEMARTDSRGARREALLMRAEMDKLREIATDADDYIGDLYVRWPHHRQQDRPPPWRWHADNEGQPQYRPVTNTD